MKDYLSAESLSVDSAKALRKAAYDLLIKITCWFPHILDRKIILGFIVEGKTSRWLTNDEISSGVIDAVKKDSLEYIIGTLTP